MYICPDETCVYILEREWHLSTVWDGNGISTCLGIKTFYHLTHRQDQIESSINNGVGYTMILNGTVTCKCPSFQHLQDYHMLILLSLSINNTYMHKGL